MRVWPLLMVLASPAVADSAVATRTIRAQTVIAPGDVVLVAADIPDALASIEEAIGREARVTLYAGRPIRPEDLGTPTLVQRNQKVVLVFQAGGLSIRLEGRALERGGQGDLIRVMNMSSRQTVNGTVAADGTVRVGPNEG